MARCFSSVVSCPEQVVDFSAFGGSRFGPHLCFPVTVGACPGPGPKKTSKEEDPKQTQSRPINPKQPGITQGFPALFSQLAFFKASFWETPCRGRGSLYIARGWMVRPFLFIFPLRGLPGARPQEDLQRRRPKADPKQTNQPKAEIKAVAEALKRKNATCLRNLSQKRNFATQKRNFSARFPSKLKL